MPVEMLFLLLGLAGIVIVILVIRLAIARVYMAGMKDAFSTIREQRYIQ